MSPQTADRIASLFIFAIGFVFGAVLGLGLLIWGIPPLHYRADSATIQWIQNVSPSELSAAEAERVFVLGVLLVFGVLGGVSAACLRDRFWRHDGDAAWWSWLFWW